MGRTRGDMYMLSCWTTIVRSCVIISLPGLSITTIVVLLETKTRKKGKTKSSHVIRVNVSIACSRIFPLTRVISFSRFHWSVCDWEMYVGEMP